MTRDALDLFSGARGWDVAAEKLGWTTYGVEHWEPARRTAEAAAFRHHPLADVREVNGKVWPGRPFDLHLASPSCKPFSPAGTGDGRRSMAVVLAGVRAVAEGARPTMLGLDPETALVLEPLRIALEGMPRVIAWEQSDRVLPVWQECAVVLIFAGYSVAVDVLDAVNYGVPANRKRAVLIARRDGITATMPKRTHGPFPHLLPYVTMADALGWPEATQLVSNYGTGGDPKKRGVRWGYQPSFAITGRADRNKVFMDPDKPGRNMTRAEAATLQTFPDGYPFQGTATDIGQQIGNAVPPVLAHAILKDLAP